MHLATPAELRRWIVGGERDDPVHRLGTPEEAGRARSRHLDLPGAVVVTGGAAEDNPGYDLTGAVVGSEGTFGVVSRTWVRITRNPEAYRTLLGVFETVDDATNAISDIIGAGIIPGALEMLDRLILQAVEAAFHFGFPLDAGAVLIMEVDGLAAGLDAEEP